MHCESLEPLFAAGWSRMGSDHGLVACSRKQRAGGFLEFSNELCSLGLQNLLGTDVQLIVGSHMQAMKVY